MSGRIVVYAFSVFKRMPVVLTTRSSVLAGINNETQNLTELKSHRLSEIEKREQASG